MTTIFLASVCALFAPQEWQPIDVQNAPRARTDETVTQCGAEILVFGGLDASDRYLGDGAAYDIRSDRWQTLPAKGAPSSRAWHTAVWSGRELLVWGGHCAEDEERGDGAAFDPQTHTWRPLPQKNAPSPRGSHVAVWTGTEMIVWGGADEQHAFPTGAALDPAKGAWRSVSIGVGDDVPTPRTLPAVWTGRRMLAWGGINGGSVLGHGVAFDPKTGEYRAMPSRGAPLPRANFCVAWTGRELLIWGGSRSIYGGRPLGDGARFDPKTDRWRPLTADDAPAVRYGAASVWNGTEWWILGGATQREGDALRDAHAWHPKTGWRRLPDLPAARAHAHAFATKRGVFLIGGRDGKAPRAGGFRFVDKRPTSRPVPSETRRDRPGANDGRR